MKLKNSLRLAFASIKNRKHTWIRIVFMTAISLSIFILSATIFRSIDFFLHDYLLGHPSERCIEVGFPNDFSNEGQQFLESFTKDNPKTITAFLPLESPVLTIENQNGLLGNNHLNSQSHRYGSVLFETDQYYDQRYLVSGRWIEPNETDVVVIPKSFAPNLEDDLSQWDFKQPCVDGDTLIGKEIVLKFADSNLDGRSPYRGKIIGTYDNVRGGTQSGTIILPHSDALRLTNIETSVNGDHSEESLVTYFYLMVHDRKDVAPVMDALESRLSIADITPQSGKGTLELFADTLRISGSLIGTFLLLITVIITMSNYTSMIESRKSELGIYEAVGYTKKQIKRNLTIEIILVGLTAFVISIIISGIIVGVISMYISTKGSLLVTSIQLKWSWTALLISLLLSILVPLLGSIKGLKYQKKLEIIEALRTF